MITINGHDYIIDDIRDGTVYMRPVRGGVAYLPGVAIAQDEIMMELPNELE